MAKVDGDPQDAVMLLAVWVEAARDLAHSRQYRYQTAGTPGSRDEATYQSGKAHAFDDVLRKIKETFTDHFGASEQGSDSTPLGQL